MNVLSFKNPIRAVMLLLLFATTAHAQSLMTGVVLDGETKESLPGVNITIKGKPNAGYTSNDGKFSFDVKEYPVTLVFSFLGFETREIEVTGPGELTVEMQPAAMLIQEVVVAASRTTQRKIESPVTIERLNSKDLVNSPQVNYYDMIQGLKGVDVTVSSIGFTSVTTRGFNTSGNTNFLQLVDGMDNQAPGLNFPLGNVLGPSQLDVDNIELLTGASSALYGSRGLNGAMIMTSKNPFKYEGVSFLLTQGVNHVGGGNAADPVGPSPYTDFSLRWAKKFDERLAFKINFQYTKANDWVANDSTNKNGPGTRFTDPNYNGVNKYGGATSVDINPFLGASLPMLPPELVPVIEGIMAEPNYVSRTGYDEYGYLNNDIKIMKANAEVRYKFSPAIEGVFSGTFGTGSVVYTNDTRYQLQDFKVGQYRAEVNSKNWFVRLYTTQENSGNTLVAGPTAQYINEAWKPSFNEADFSGWYPDYTGAFIQAIAMGADVTTAHLQARSYADIGRPESDSPYFKHLQDSISQKPITEGGTLFLDRSKLYNAEFQYSFVDQIKWAEIIAGLNYRLYNLNSKGTLFPDEDGPIRVNEYSGYVQVIKRLMQEKLTLTGSLRIDQNSLFGAAKPTTRLSSVYQVADQNYLRFSYQNAYSFPSNIQSLQNTLNGYRSYASGGSSYLLNDIYEFDQYHPYTWASIEEYRSSGDAADLEEYDVNDIKPQSANSFELGYAAVFGSRVLVDILGYYATWKNFIGYIDVGNTPGTNDPAAFLDPNATTKYNIAYNGAEKVDTYGFAASISLDLTKGFVAKANYYTDHMKDFNDNNTHRTRFNTPSYHFNFEFGNTGFGKKKEFSFNASLRYKPGYLYEVAGGLGEGTVPSSTVIDAQAGYKLTKIRSSIKIGATNLTNKYYSTGIANPMIGGMYYVSLGYNVF